jgi:apolipoprotein N-acyltransferase
MSQASPTLVWEYRSAAFRMPPRKLVAPVCAGAAAILLWLCYFPIACGWLAWVALVPLLGLVRLPGSSRQIYGFSWLAGLLFFGPSLQWMRVADYRMYATWAALTIYCSLYFPAAVYLVRRLDRKTSLPLCLTFPAVWTGLEYARSHVLGGFPWYFLSHTQHDCLALIQIADLGGAYTLTFLVAMANAVAFEILWRLSVVRRLLGVSGLEAPSSTWPIMLQTVAMVGLLGAAAYYGNWRLAHEEFAEGPRLALVQGNLDQDIKNEASESAEEAAIRRIIKHYADLTELAASRPQMPDLIVWPETSLPLEWEESRTGEETDASKQIGRWAAREAGARSRILLGLNSRVTDPDGRAERFNSAILIGPQGKIEGRYDKIHRVPFGEYVPGKDWLPWMNRFAPYDFDYSIQPGGSQKCLPLGKYRFGVLICYEDTDDTLTRGYVVPGLPTAHFLMNISNDGWFKGTSEHDQHLAICRFRAVETRRALARSVNMGISAIIDPSGRVLAAQPAPTDVKGAKLWEIEPSRPAQSLPVSAWPSFKKVAGVIEGHIPLDHRVTWYARWGDWLPACCGLIVAAGLLWSLWPGVASAPLTRRP